MGSIRWGLTGVAGTVIDILTGCPLIDRTISPVTHSFDSILSAWIQNPPVRLQSQRIGINTEVFGILSDSADCNKPQCKIEFAVCYLTLLLQKPNGPDG